jgi:hypothetical protein
MYEYIFVEHFRIRRKIILYENRNEDIVDGVGYIHEDFFTILLPFI